MLGYRSVRKSPAAAAVSVSPMALFFFDNLFYVFAGGLVIVAIWLTSLARYNETAELPDWTKCRNREPPSTTAGSPNGNG